MSSIFQLAYLSEATHPIDEEDLTKLLNVARAANAKISVTGLLSYNAGHFLQLLEGQEKKVNELFKHIARDPRHDKLKTVYEGANTKRLFPDWTMAYRRIDEYSLSLRDRLENMVGTISRGEELYNAKDVLTLFQVMSEQV